MEIAIAADHGGFQLKEKIRAHLIESGYTVKEFWLLFIRKRGFSRVCR